VIHKCVLFKVKKYDKTEEGVKKIIETVFYKLRSRNIPQSSEYIIVLTLAEKKLILILTFIFASFYFD
jgi:hypothetical protein